MAKSGCSTPACPRAAKMNPNGVDPQMSAAKNANAGILVSPAMQAMTSGKTGSQRERTTSQPP